jgi:hypothetical protein
MDRRRRGDDRAPYGAGYEDGGVVEFSKTATAGNGSLLVPAIQSPNFVHGVSGWSVNKDGSAEFQDVVLPEGTGGPVTTFSATAPANPNPGDVWYDTSEGLLAQVWSQTTTTSGTTMNTISIGTTPGLAVPGRMRPGAVSSTTTTTTYAWVPYSIGTGAIASGAITTALIASGAVTQDQLDGSITARSLGGITTTIAGTAPTDPNTGDVWINSAAGNQLNQWSGTSWTALSWDAGSVLSAGTITGDLIAADTISAGQIEAGTITANEIASGTVLAGSVNGTTITGATFEGTNWIENSSGMFLYSGTPAAGNLSASIAPVAGTDAFGNSYQAGTNVYGTGTSLTGIQDISGQAVLFFMPDASSAFSNAISPSIFSVDTGTGTTEYMELQVVSGAPSGFVNRRSRVILFSGSPDSTTSVPHVGIYGGNNDSLLVDINQNGITAVQPGTSATLETWHDLPRVNGWAPTSDNLNHYRLTADNEVEIMAALSGGSATTIATLPVGYRPANHTMYFPVGGTGTVPQLYAQLSTAGVLSLSTLSSVGTIIMSARVPLDIP